MIVVYEDNTLENTEDNNRIASNADSKIYEQHLQSIKDMIKKAKELELQRLAQECMLNSYETKYNTNLKEVLSAIVGAESLDRYMAVIVKEQKQLKDRLDSVKTFSFASRGNVNNN